MYRCSSHLRVRLSERYIQVRDLQPSFCSDVRKISCNAALQSIRYGTRKMTFLDGSSLVEFANGDTHTTYPDGVMDRLVPNKQPLWMEWRYKSLLRGKWKSTIRIERKKQFIRTTSILLLALMEEKKLSILIGKRNDRMCSCRGK